MMNWNNNDTKYILKRVIVYFIIASILFFAGQRCAKATVISTSTSNTSPLYYTCNTMSCVINTNTNFANQEGHIIFQLTAQYSGSQSSPASGIANLYVQSANAIFMCNVGSTYYYQDSVYGVQMLSVECPIQTSTGINKIVINRTGAAGTMQGVVSNYMTIVTTESEASSINNQISQQMTSDAQNTQAIVDRIFNSSQQEIYYENQNAAQAHQDAQDTQQAINNLNDTINSDYTFDSDLNDMFNFGDLFQADDDFIRRVLMLPFTILGLIANTASLDTCVQYDFGELFGYHLIFPCITWKNYVGTGIYLTIDTIFGICLLFGLIRYIIGLFDYIFSVGLKGTGVALSVATEAFK